MVTRLGRFSWIITATLKEAKKEAQGQDSKRQTTNSKEMANNAVQIWKLQQVGKLGHHSKGPQMSSHQRHHAHNALQQQQCCPKVQQLPTAGKEVQQFTAELQRTYSKSTAERMWPHGFIVRSVCRFGCACLFCSLFAP